MRKADFSVLAVVESVYVTYVSWIPLALTWGGITVITHMFYSSQALLNCLHW